MSARLRFGDFIFIFTVMSHNQLVVCQMVVSCFGYIYMYTRDQEIWESGVLGTGKRCEAETETWASARGWLVGWLVGWMERRGVTESQSQIKTP